VKHKEVEPFDILTDWGGIKTGISKMSVCNVIYIILWYKDGSLLYKLIYILCYNEDVSL